MSRALLTLIQVSMALRSLEMGFSQKTCLPFSTAARICSTWKGVGDLYVYTVDTQDQAGQSHQGVPVGGSRSELRVPPPPCPPPETLLYVRPSYNRQAARTR